MYNYLKDTSFLQLLTTERLVEQHIKITALTMNEKPIKAIEGKVTGGNLNLDGKSAIRRTCNLSMYADSRENDLTDIDNLFSINKKVKVEVGLKNTTAYYLNDDILWFPLGIYIITAPSLSHGMNGMSISLTLKDKMCLLNGDCGGILPNTVIFHEYETMDSTTGEYYITRPTMIQIIQELVHHWGGEQLGKIFINDLSPRVRQAERWMKEFPLYRITEVDENGTATYHYTTEVPAEESDLVVKTEAGTDVGFIYVDFTYPHNAELIGNAGATVCSILDTVKNLLGNYEYFYDVYGNFIFQEVKNYLNISKSTSDLYDYEKMYSVDRSNGKAVFIYDDAKITTSFSNNPQYNMIKNDFVVWGKKNELPIRYHLVIDKKPKVGNEYTFFLYTEGGLKLAARPTSYDSKEQLPQPGDIERFVSVGEEVLRWNGKTYVTIEGTWVTRKTTDWREELYFSALETNRFGTNSHWYREEILTELPKMWDFENGTFSKDKKDFTYYLDFIDSQAPISELNVSNIGRRTKVLNDKKINCIFETEIPNFILIEAGQENTDELRAEAVAQGQPYIQVDSNVYNGLTTGGTENSAYVAICDLLYQYTSYNEAITIQTIPQYFLEPNIRISVRDAESGISGDYMINSMSIPLDISGTMSLSCTRALQKL